MSGINMDEVLTRMRTNITDLDLERFFPETNHYKDNVIKYSELANYNSIEELSQKIGLTRLF